jgi:predicted NodU family carbamoyl transferase
MRYCGFSEFFHDAGIAFITSEGDIQFASHAERYSR